MRTYLFPLDGNHHVLGASSRMTLFRGEISMRIQRVRFSVVPPRHAKLESHGTMTQNDLFCNGNWYADQVLSFLCYGDDFKSSPKGDIRTPPRHT